MIGLLSGRYRLSRREVRELLQDLWQVLVSLGAVVRQEQAPSAALAPVVEKARAAVQQADVVNMDDTGWRQERKQAWLWTTVAAGLTVFQLTAVVVGPPWQQCWVPSSVGSSDGTDGPPTAGSRPNDAPCAGRT